MRALCGVRVGTAAGKKSPARIPSFRSRLGSRVPILGFGAKPGQPLLRNAEPRIVRWFSSLLPHATRATTI